MLVSAVVLLLLIGLQVAFIVSAYIGPKENRMNLMGAIMLALPVFIAAAATLAFAHGTKGQPDPPVKSRISVAAIQRFALAALIVQFAVLLSG